MKYDPVIEYIPKEYTTKKGIVLKMKSLFSLFFYFHTSSIPFKQYNNMISHAFFGWYCKNLDISMG